MNEAERAFARMMRRWKVLIDKATDQQNVLVHFDFVVWHKEQGRWIRVDVKDAKRIARGDEEKQEDVIILELLSVPCYIRNGQHFLKVSQEGSLYGGADQMIFRKLDGSFDVIDRDDLAEVVTRMVNFDYYTYKRGVVEKDGKYIPYRRREATSGLHTGEVSDLIVYIPLTEIAKKVEVANIK